jgi:hypothetical protein
LPEATDAICNFNKPKIDKRFNRVADNIANVLFHCFANFGYTRLRPVVLSVVLAAVEAKANRGLFPAKASQYCFSPITEGDTMIGSTGASGSKVSGSAGTLKATAHRSRQIQPILP